MSELDTERIGQELRMSWSAYLIKHEPAIIAALEDRERLPTEMATEMVQTAFVVNRHLRKHCEGYESALRGLLAICVASRMGGTAGELSRYLGLTSGATTRIIDGMVKAGWAERIVGDDRRQRFVQPTAAGTAKAREVLAALEGCDD